MQLPSDYTPSFEDLPRRIFLDSSTLQLLQDYGEFIYENVEPSADNRIYKITDGYEELDALRAIFFVNQRAMFEFALSKHSIIEVSEKGDPSYLQWAYEVVAHWEECIAAYHESPFNRTGCGLASRLSEQRFRYLSEKDRFLLRDALALECAAFLTMDRKLAKNRGHLLRETNLHILLPTQFWAFLRPWAAVYV